MKDADLYKIHLSVFLFGFAGLFGKWIHLDAITIVWGRVLFASIAFGFYFLWQKRNPFYLSLKMLLVYFFLGSLLAFHWWSFYKSVKLSTVAIALFSFTSFPIFTVFLEPLFFKLKWKAIYFVLAFVSMLGIYLLLPQIDLNHVYFWGVFWGVWSGFSFSVLTILNRILLKGQEAIDLAFFQDFFAFLCLSPFIIILHPSIEINHWLLLALMGIVFTALAHFLFIKGLVSVQAQTAAIIANLEAVYGAFFAYLLLSESLSIKNILGGLIILLAAVFSAWYRKK